MKGACGSILMLILTFHVENVAVGNRTTLSSTKKPESEVEVENMDEKCKKEGKKEDDKWKYFESKCYKLFHKDKYFIKSREECMNNDGDLVSIKNLQENTFVSTLIDQSQHKEAWIGYKMTKEKYSWVDGSAFNLFTNWMNGAPRDSKDEVCAEMITGGEWVNILCFNQKSFICKKDPIPSKPKSNLRIILTITISVSCIFIMFTFVGFLCLKSHKELEAVESQVKEAVPFEIVKAAMVLPMAKPPDLLDHKVDNTWQRTIKSITTPSSAHNSRQLQENATKPDVITNERKDKDNSNVGPSNLVCSSTSKGNNTSSKNTYVGKQKQNNGGNPSIEKQPKLTPSCGGNPNYLSKVDKWLKESPESPTHRKRPDEGSVRRKHFQQRGSQKRKDITEIPEELEENFPFNEDEEKELNANPNLLDHSLKKTLQRQNVISVTADVNFPRNNSTSTTSDTDNAKSPCLGDKKRRKRPALMRPEGEEINGNFLFLKTLTYSQDTDFSDLSEQRNEEKLDNSKLSVDNEQDKHEPQPKLQDSPAQIRSRKLKDEYQLVTFV